MYLDPFYQISEDNLITILPEQASRFAKEVADDFNPLHNPDSKRFCVPGDLLFALLIARKGLSQKMAFSYTGMVGKGVSLKFPTNPGDNFYVTDNAQKHYLDVTREGEQTNDLEMIEAFTRAYVAFSGHSFPHILVPLMKKEGLMINPDKPMVIYKEMSFQFDTLDVKAPSLALVESTFEMAGKRGNVRLKFEIKDSDKVIGKGCKTLVLSGLREYDDAKIETLVSHYEDIKNAYQA